MRSVDAQAILDEFTGELEQLPPAYSAIKKNGVVAYKAAREGTCLELEARHVTVYGAQLVGAGVCEAELICADGNTSVRELPFWDVHFDVSKGTYIRALARDIGAYLGCGAHLGSLRRTSVATMGIDEACSIDELADRAEAGGMLPWCDPARLLGFPIIELGEQQAQCVANGRELTDISAGEGMISCIRDNKLLAVYNFVAGAWSPRDGHSRGCHRRWLRREPSYGAIQRRFVRVRSLHSLRSVEMTMAPFSSSAFSMACTSVTGRFSRKRAKGLASLACPSSP